MKGILEKWWTRVSPQKSPRLDHKELLLDQGFLVYVTRTYPAMIPYLKGFHLTIEMWWSGRDSDGWKVKNDSSAETPEAQRDEDEDSAGMGHKLRRRTGCNGEYTPEDGFTWPVP